MPTIYSILILPSVIAIIKVYRAKMVLLPTFLVVLDIASFVLGASISNRSNGGKSFTVPLRRQMSYKANSLRADLTKRADGSAQATNFATHVRIDKRY